jgi:hypothetical protein
MDIIDHALYVEYLRGCSTQQVWQHYEENTKAGRHDYAVLCVNELFARGEDE